jgi:hypothetical protein
VRPRSDFPAHTRNPAADFGTILKNQSARPATAPAATAPPAPAPAAPSGTTVPVAASSRAVAAVPAAPTCQLAPTAQSIFGANPWSTTAGGTGFNGASYSYNKYYFATPETAAKVAQMLGGTVVAMDAITSFGPFVQNQPNQMVQMPDGKLINAGLVAEFYDHGFTQPMVDKLIAAEIAG